MTRKYTADDFANAKFAEHPGTGEMATRDTGDPDYQWGTTSDALHDRDMARYGWVPVPTKPTMTDSEYRDNTDGQDGIFKLGYYRGFRAAGGVFIPNPEPTDEELLAGIIRGIDDWQSITSPELLAKYLNTAGVTPPNAKGN